MAVLDLRLPDKMKKEIVARARGQHRKTSEQARRYLQLAIAAEDNPELPFSMIVGIVEGLAELKAGLVEPLDRS